ncbi:MAG: ABC transporter permease [Candidatus Omnitrophota bacterium]|nr:ABC transporter permease [Candidatus Omnitrophota bacterium]MDZ4242738.1 ABC transporter permease [Candidatus Omnitrophota bacterium]
MLILRFFENIGSRVREWVQILLEFSNLCYQTAYWIIRGPAKNKPIKRPAVFEQMVFMGAKSIIIVFFVTLFTGIVLAMQSAYQLTKLGGTIYVASLVSISICRELGPVLTALVIAGRIGAAITAEIGSMKVNEQIEALEAMAINPIRFLVVPKVVALFLMLPCLTVIGDVSGILGGYLIGVYNLKINSYLYMQTAFKYLALKDIYTGLLKSFVFAVIIAMVGCYQGLSTKGGAVGVGRATTISVVTSFILIIIADCVITGIFFFAKM